MDQKVTQKIVLHGAIVMLAGFAVGFPFAFVASGSMEGEVRAWRMAHMEGVINSIFMFAVAALVGKLSLDASKKNLLANCMIATGYLNIVASTLGAATGNRGLTPGGPIANWAVLILFTIGIITALIAMILLIMGARGAASGPAAQVTVEVNETPRRSSPAATPKPPAAPSAPAGTAAAVTSVSTSVDVSVSTDDDDDDDDDEPMSRAERRRRKKRK